VAEHASAVPAGTDLVSPREKYYFLLRRLHSLTGLVPIGAYVVVHLIVNATIVAGPKQYQFAVDQIHNLKRMGILLPVEMAFIFLPIAFHAVLGLVIVLGGTSNAGQYRYGPNIRYTLERWTGVLIFFFVILHVWQMHWLGKPFGGAKFDAEAASSTAALAIQSSWWWAPIYSLGVLCVAFHLANGTWTALITWGVTIGARAQKISGYICTALGVFLAVVGLGAVCGFYNYDAAHDRSAHHATEIARTAIVAPAIVEN
jgi:succinate dehydrogenase / fumarate reductase cytochrome b subunit